MPKKATKSKRTPAPAPVIGNSKKGSDKKRPKVNPLIEKRPRNFGIGQDIQPKRDLTRFVRWPHYIKVQRQRRILMQRLKVPPTVNQFTKTLPKNSASQLFKLLNKYRPETKVAKKKRLLQLAEAKTKGEIQKTEKPNVVKFGINHVTHLVEQKQAKLVVIAHDVDPIELVVWLPTLCRKMEVPYCIVKGKARLGAVVHQKTATALALTTVSKEDKNDFTQLSTLAKESYNQNTEVRRLWGGGRLGAKARAAQRKKAKALAKELKK
jgi:large subunit ribosomal protein L7Ae